MGKSSACSGEKHRRLCNLMLCAPPEPVGRLTQVVSRRLPYQWPPLNDLNGHAKQYLQAISNATLRVALADPVEAQYRVLTPCSKPKSCTSSQPVPIAPGPQCAKTSRPIAPQSATSRPYPDTVTSNDGEALGHGLRPVLRTRDLRRNAELLSVL